MCANDGMVCLRWFKNHFLLKGSASYAKQMHSILKEIEKGIKGGQNRIKRSDGNLPDILG